jgi:putative ABC transport system permease protein
MNVMLLTPAMRALIRRPALTAARLVTVTAVVAAIASVTAIASATLFRRLPFPEPHRLVQINLLDADVPDIASATPLFPLVFNHLDARGPSLEAVAGIWRLDRAIAGGGEPESLPAGRVTANFFAMFGAALAAGRTFTDDEVQSDAALVVLSHGLWTRMFGADPAIIGTALRIDRRPHTVIGVTAPGFDPAFTSTEFWTPLRVRDSVAVRATVVQTIGRLRRGATVAAATSDLQPVLAAASGEAPDLMLGSAIGALDLRHARYGPRRNALLLMTVIVAALGLIATANLANLTFADLASRLNDLALRSALGGSTSAIVMAEMVPCALLALLGSAFGLWLAATAAPWMLSFDPSLATSGIAISVDWRVALVGVIAALTVMAAAVALPGWRVARRDQLSLLGGQRSTGARGGIRTFLVGAQVAVALVLLSAAALVIAALQRNASADPGFDRANVITAQLRLSEQAFADHTARVRFIRDVLERLHETPGVVGAGTTLNPFAEGGAFTTNVSVEDAPRPDGQPYTTQFRRVSPGYFETMRIRVQRGRTFLPTDTETTRPIAVVSRAFAERYWANGDAIGRRVKRGAATSPWLEIAGVVDDVRDAGLTQDTGPVIYTSYYQGSTGTTPAGLVVRTAGDPRPMIQRIKAAVWAVDPQQPLSNIVLLPDYLDASLGPQQFRAWLVTLCGATGILLAIVGIYGVTARSVSERTREIGIRIALGGHPLNVWRRIVLASLRAVLAGVAAGAALSFMVDGGLVRLLPELGAADWIYRSAAAMILIAAGAAAAMIAARLATSIEPITALRQD